MKYEWQHDKAVTVLYKNYKFMPKGIITQLVVALHTYITDQQRCVWRSGMVLEDRNTYAEIIENYNTREIKITVAGDNCRNFMTIIMHELKAIHDSYNNELEYDVLIPCSCEQPHHFNYQTLQECANDRVPIQCTKKGCWKMLDARDLIDGVFNPQDINKGDLSMSEKMGTTINNTFNAPINGAVSTGNGTKHGHTMTGKHATLNHNETHNTQNQGIQADLKSLSDLLRKLNLGENQEKVEKLLTTAETEIKADTPDKEEIGSSLDRAIKIAKKTGQLSDEIIPLGQKIGEYLGEYGETIIDTLSQIPA